MGMEIWCVPSLSQRLRIPDLGVPQIVPVEGPLRLRLPCSPKLTSCRRTLVPQDSLPAKSRNPHPQSDFWYV